MKFKVEKVIIGLYEYDSIIGEIDGLKTEIVFDKKDDISKFDGKIVELIQTKQGFEIKEVKVSK